MATINIEEVPQLSISRLKSCYVQDGKTNSGTYKAFDSDPLLYLDSNLIGDQKILSIRYQKINTSVWMDYEIKIEAAPLNFGNGANLFFICPTSGKRAKILYYDLKTHYFVHREAYSKRLYYPIQTFGKVKRISENIRIHEEKLIRCFLQLKNENYGDKVPKTYMKIMSLQKRKELLELLQTNYLTKKFSAWEKKLIN